MELLKFKVSHQKLSGGRYKPVSGSIDYIEAVFDFTSEWDGLDKWAHFTKGDVTYDLNLKDDRITREKHLNLEAGTWEVKVHGDENSDGEIVMRITTDTAYVTVEDFGELHEGGVLPEAVTDAAEQIAAKVQNALENSEEALAIAKAIEEAAANGDFDGEKGEAGITPDIQIGTVETLEPGEEVTVSIEGTPEEPILNIGIPKGEKGEDGEGKFPTPGEEDEEKILQVVDGVWTAVAVEDSAVAIFIDDYINSALGGDY